MRKLGHVLMGLGAALGGVVSTAALLHLGLAGVPWLVNVALAKLGLIGAAGLMAGGATSIKLANRRKARELGDGRDL